MSYHLLTIVYLSSNISAVKQSPKKGVSKMCVSDDNKSVIPPSIPSIDLSKICTVDKLWGVCTEKTPDGKGQCRGPVYKIEEDVFLCSKCRTLK